MIKFAIVVCLFVLGQLSNAAVFSENVYVQKTAGTCDETLTAFRVKLDLQFPAKIIQTAVTPVINESSCHVSFTYMAAAEVPLFKWQINTADGCSDYAQVAEKRFSEILGHPYFSGGCTSDGEFEAMALQQETRVTDEERSISVMKELSDSRVQSVLSLAGAWDLYAIKNSHGTWTSYAYHLPISLKDITLMRASPVLPVHFDVTNAGEPDSATLATCQKESALYDAALKDIDPAGLGAICKGWFNGANPRQHGYSVATFYLAGGRLQKRTSMPNGWWSDTVPIAGSSDYPGCQAGRKSVMDSYRAASGKQVRHALCIWTDYEYKYFLIGQE